MRAVHMQKKGARAMQVQIDPDLAVLDEAMKTRTEEIAKQQEAEEKRASAQKTAVEQDASAEDMHQEVVYVNSEDPGEIVHAMESILQRKPRRQSTPTVMVLGGEGKRIDAAAGRKPATGPGRSQSFSKRTFIEDSDAASRLAQLTEMKELEQPWSCPFQQQHELPSMIPATNDAEPQLGCPACNSMMLQHDRPDSWSELKKGVDHAQHCLQQPEALERQYSDCLDVLAALKCNDAAGRSAMVGGLPADVAGRSHAIRAPKAAPQHQPASNCHIRTSHPQTARHEHLHTLSSWHQQDSNYQQLPWDDGRFEDSFHSDPWAAADGKKKKPAHLHSGALQHQQNRNQAQLPSADNSVGSSMHSVLADGKEPEPRTTGSRKQTKPCKHHPVGSEGRCDAREINGGDVNATQDQLQVFCSDADGPLSLHAPDAKASHRLPRIAVPKRRHPGPRPNDGRCEGKLMLDLDHSKDTLHDASGQAAESGSGTKELHPGRPSLPAQALWHGDSHHAPRQSTGATVSMLESIQAAGLARSTGCHVEASEDQLPGASAPITSSQSLGPQDPFQPHCRGHAVADFHDSPALANLTAISDLLAEQSSSHSQSTAGPSAGDWKAGSSQSNLADLASISSAASSLPDLSTRLSKQQSGSGIGSREAGSPQSKPADVASSSSAASRLPDLSARLQKAAAASKSRVCSLKAASSQSNPADVASSSSAANSLPTLLTSLLKQQSGAAATRRAASKEAAGSQSNPANASSASSAASSSHEPCIASTPSIKNLSSAAPSRSIASRGQRADVDSEALHSAIESSGASRVPKQAASSSRRQPGASTRKRTGQGRQASLQLNINCKENQSDAETASASGSTPFREQRLHEVILYCQLKLLKNPPGIGMPSILEAVKQVLAPLKLPSGAPPLSPSQSEQHMLAEQLSAVTAAIGVKPLRNAVRQAPSLAQAAVQTHGSAAHLFTGPAAEILLLLQQRLSNMDPEAAKAILLKSLDPVNIAAAHTRKYKEEPGAYDHAVWMMLRQQFADLGLQFGVQQAFDMLRHALQSGWTISEVEGSGLPASKDHTTVSRKRTIWDIALWASFSGDSVSQAMAAKTSHKARRCHLGVLLSISPLQVPVTMASLLLQLAPDEAWDALSSSIISCLSLSTLR